MFTVCLPKNITSQSSISSAFATAVSIDCISLSKKISSSKIRVFSNLEFFILFHVPKCDSAHPKTPFVQIPVKGDLNILENTPCFTNSDISKD